jgi:glycosyltransferase involved in cell wall biosynthesis
MRVAMLLHKSVQYDSRVRREARTLVEAGHAVTVVELEPAAAGRLDGFTRVSASPPSWVRRALPFQLYRVVFLGAFLLRLLRLRPDVVHAHDAAMLLPGLLGARLTRARLVYDSHELATGVPYRDGRWAAFVRAIERIAVPRADAVITVTEGIAERMQALYGLRQRPAVVRNVTELTAPAAPTGALRARLGIEGEPLILHQGAPAPDRGGEQLIVAMAELPAAHLVFLGSSPFSGYEDGLREQAAAAGLADRVHFLPSVPLERLLEHTADADVGVSLLQDSCENHRLALPNKVFEYVAAGVPIVVSALPELIRLVEENGIGWTVPPADPAALAERLRAALAERGDPARAERLARAAEALSWARERGRLEAVYRSLA